MAETSPTSSSRIVVGVDGSEQSKRALRWARHLATSNGSSIDAVMVWSPPIVWGYGWTNVTGGWDPLTDAEKALTATVDEVFGADRPAGLTLHTVEGYPAHCLLEAARSATMLILGSRGHGGLAGVLIGSVSAMCAEHAVCPVLVVHDTEPPGTGDARVGIETENFGSRQRTGIAPIVVPAPR